MLRESLRLKRALEFYANQANYIDGVPMHSDDDGMLTAPDDGYLALSTLRRLDLKGEPFMAFTEEGKNEPNDTADSTRATAH